MIGKIFIVGIGPGGGEYLTVKALDTVESVIILLEV